MRIGERRRAAIQAATDLGHSLGISFDHPRLLKDSNNTVVHLAPSPVVAKVGTSHFREARLESLVRELSVALHLAARGAPIVPPLSDLPGPHRVGEFTITLWQLCAPLPTASPKLGALGRTLRVVHEALADYPAPLPSFTVELNDVARLLADRRRLGGVSDRDHDFLRATYAVLQPLVSRLEPAGRLLHGSPHGGNFLLSPTGPLLLDFETACRGPLEWDLSAMADEEVVVFPGVDREALAILRRFRSLSVAVKCAIEPDRASELAEAIEVHLRLLRGEVLP